MIDTLTQYFSFDVWINNETPIINCNIEKGGSTTKTLEIYYNPTLIYSELGNCTITLTYKNNVETIDINAETIASLAKSESDIVSYEIENYGSWIVQLKSETNTISSFVVSKIEPLNTIAIIVIVLVSVILVVGTFVFIKLRTRMKIR